MTKPPNGVTDTARRASELVDGLDLDAASKAEVAAAAERLAALGREAVTGLVRDTLQRGTARRDKAAALLGCLSGTPARWALGELERLLDTRPLTATEQMWLTALFRRLEEAVSPQGAEAEDLPLADGLLDDEAELLLWRDEFASLPAADQQAVLAPILQDGNPAVLRLLEVAMSLRIAHVDSAVAGGLSRFATPEALPLLRELLQRGDPAVRKQARAAVVALERRGVATRELFVATAESAEPVRVSLATLPERDGRMMVLVARGRMPGQLRFAAVVIDPVELGIATAWGESGLTEGDLQQRLTDYTRKMQQRLVRVDLGLAQALVAAAEDYAAKQGRAVPADYLVWRRYIGRPKTPVELPIVFGPSCSRCHSRLRSGDLLRGGVIAGRAALCARCFAGPLACAGCGRPLDRHADEILARESADGAKVEFICRYCVGRAGQPRGR